MRPAAAEQAEGGSGSQSQHCRRPGSSESAPGSPVPVADLVRSTYGSPPAHLHRPDRRRGCPGLRSLHRLELLLQEANMVTTSGILHDQRGATQCF